METLIAGIVPVLSTESDPNNHFRWGNAGGLLRTPRRGRNAARGRARIGARQRTGDGNQASAYTSNVNQSLDSADDTSDEELPRTENYSGPVVLNPIQHALLKTTRRFSLAFPHASLERQYQEWRGARMALVDGVALATLLAYHITRALAKKNSTRSAGNVIVLTMSPFVTEISRWEYLPCIIIIIPLLLALLPLTHKWYSQRRDVIVVFLYIFLAWHHIMAGAGTCGSASVAAAASRWSGDNKDSEASSMFSIVVRRLQQHLRNYECSATLLSSTAILIEMMSSLESIWISVLSIIVNVRHPWQTLMLFIAVAVSLLVAVDVCPGGAVATACWMAVTAKVVVAQLLLPAIAIYWLEYAARRTFCSTPAASYFAWRLEGTRSAARTRRRQ